MFMFIFYVEVVFMLILGVEDGMGGVRGKNRAYLLGGDLGRD